VTPEEWEVCENPGSLWWHLREAGRLTPRRSVLLACACCRRIWRLVPDEGCRKAVQAAESWAVAGNDDGWVTAALESVQQACKNTAAKTAARAAGAAVALILYAVTHNQRGEELGFGTCVESAIGNAADAAIVEAGELAKASRSSRAKDARRAERRQEHAAQAALTRCIFRNPFLPPFAVSPDALRHNDGAAVKLATVFYDERDPETGLLDPVGLAMLADALEEAGVDDAAALKHLRSPDSPHCRGCFVVDAVRGRG
jgi:hypothetical protein